MNDYKRLVSYIYSYPGNVKDKNTGFARAQVRNGQFKLELTLNNVHTDAPEIFSVYLMVRSRNKFNTIKLDNVIINSGCGIYKDLLNPVNIKSTGYTFSDICGIAIANTDNEYYRMYTLWDDNPFNPSDVLYTSLSPDISDRTDNTITSTGNNIPDNTDNSVISTSNNIPDNTDNSVISTSNNIPDDTDNSVISTSNNIPDNAGNSVTSTSNNIPDDTDNSVISTSNNIPDNAGNSVTSTSNNIPDDTDNSVTSTSNNIPDNTGNTIISKKNISDNTDSNYASLTNDNGISYIISKKQNDNNTSLTSKINTNVNTAKETTSNNETDTIKNSSTSQPDTDNNPPVRQTDTDHYHPASHDEINEHSKPAQPEIYVTAADSSFTGNSFSAKHNFGMKDANISTDRSFDKSKDKNNTPMPLHDSYDINNSGIDKKITNDKYYNKAFEKLFKNADYIDAFDNDYYYDCIEISPEQLKALPADDINLTGNSFLIHGYYNFRHLLFGRVRENDNGTHYFIGVPGMYCNRERFMASMYGFGNFKKSHRSDYTNPYFGYWYQEI